MSERANNISYLSQLPEARIVTLPSELARASGEGKGGGRTLRKQGAAQSHEFRISTTAVPISI